MDWRDTAGVDAEADLHKVARVPVQLSKDDTLGSRQSDPNLQHHMMYQDNNENINISVTTTTYNKDMSVTSKGKDDDGFQNAVWPR